MTENQIDFKDPRYSRQWLDTALDMEKKKYAKCPVLHDLVPGQEVAQGWGYVVTGYFLVELALKALLNVRGVDPEKTHNLSDFFCLLPPEDKKVLREYYQDFLNGCDSVRGFSFSRIDDFLINLDGGKNSKGKYVGSFDWRYFLIEEMQGRKMPTVSIEFLHEIVYGATRIVEYGVYGKFKPGNHTYSWRQRFKRKERYQDWLTVRMNSGGWDKLGDRLEIVWGPDYRNWYDFFVFKEERIVSFYDLIPDDHGLPVWDKRAEIMAHPG